MKVGDLVIVAGSTPLNALVVQKLRHHLGVIVVLSGTTDGVLVAWTNGEERWIEAHMVKPYEGYAGKNDKDIK